MNNPHMQWIANIIYIDNMYADLLVDLEVWDLETLRLNAGSPASRVNSLRPSDAYMRQ